MQQLLSEIADFFRRTDSFALALLLAFLVPFVVTVLRPRQFGQNRKRILERLQEIRQKAVISIAVASKGKSIIDVIDELAEESRVILNPINAVLNPAMLAFGITAVAAGLFLVFYESFSGVVPIHAGVAWMVFVVSGIISLLYFYFEYRAWMEYQRLERKFGGVNIAAAPVVTDHSGTAGTG